MTGREVNSLDADLIVVGCGPVGVMAALRSAQRGLSVIAVDKTDEIYPLPRAIGMDDEVQRLFASAGLSEALDTHSSPLLGAEFLDAAGARVVGFEIPPEMMIGALGHPPMVMFNQPAIERELRSAAEAAGVEFRFHHEATSVDHAEAAVELSTPTGSVRIRGKWLIAADGASSAIRKLCGVELEDQGFDQPWLVVDCTRIDPDLELPTIARQYCDPARVVTYVPGHLEHRRWEFHLHDDETREAALEPAFVADLLSPWGTPEQLRVDRAAVYRFHATVAERFRTGSIFFAGDAAHQMPPFNGQGMCTGLRDAENLSWKLAMVADGHADERLLDTYEAERRPHAAGQVQHSADAGRLIDAIAAGDGAGLDAGYGGGRPFPHLEHGVVEGDHPAVGRQVPQPEIDGVRLDAHLGDGWGILASAPLKCDLAAWWRAHGATVLAVDPALVPGLIGDDTVAIIRPDRYVAAVGPDLAEATRSLDTHLHDTPMTETA
jgi:3-(3-hydroxy-phenyl)propionate hydroxylase